MSFFFYSIIAVISVIILNLKTRFIVCFARLFLVFKHAHTNKHRPFNECK